MTRKSFDLTDDELSDAKRRAGEAGVSLNQYIRLAVVEKNQRQSGTSDLLALARDAHEAIASIKGNGEQLRASLVGDAQQVMAAIDRQQADFIAKQQELLTTFLLTLGAQLRGQGTPSAGAPPKPTDPWGLDPIGPTHPHK